MMRHLNPFHHWLRHDRRRQAADGELTLADLQVHERGQVLDLRCGKMAMNRLISLGFTPGAEVDMTQNYGRGPLIVTVRGGSCGHRPRRGPAHPRGALALVNDCHSAPEPTIAIRSDTHVPLIALAGQPNLGKSTLFNLLTGLNQHVGNWPGKTVERREGRFELEGEACRLVDLPGTYSLTANSPEEVIAREFIVREKPDVVVAVVSAANLERSLYLVAELLALHAPVVVALNMMDVARQEGLVVEPEVLQAAIGVPVVPMMAVRADGARELLRVVQDTLHERRGDTPHPPEIRADHHEALDQIQHLIAGHCAASLSAGLGGAQAAGRRCGDHAAAARVDAHAGPGQRSRRCCGSTTTPCWRWPRAATNGSGAWCARRWCGRAWGRSA